MKRFLSLGLAVIMMFSMAVSVFAAENENIDAVLDRRIKVTYNGELQTFTDANGKIVYPIVYQGTTYLPVRAASALVKLPVQWDGANYTVVLGGDGAPYEAAAPVGTPLTESENIKTVLDKNIKVTFNGELQTFTDVNGKVVYPIVHEGTTYLPVRAVSNLVNLPVEWDGANYTVVLGEKAEQPVTPPAVEKELHRGVWNGKVYTNEFANLKFTLDANSVAYTDEDIIEQFGTIYDDQGNLYDMMAHNLVDGTLTMILIEDLSVKTSASEQVTADMYVELLKSQLPQAGDYTIVGTDYVELGGNDYTVLKTTNNDIFQNYYVMKVGDDHVVCLLVTGLSEAGVNAATACFN